MRKYVVAYQIALQQVLQHRATLLMDRIGGVAVFITLFYFWKTLLGDKESFLGYSGEQMISYVLLMNILRSFVFTGRGWQIVRDISSGRIATSLVRPYSYHGYSLALDMAQKTVHVSAAILEVGILVFLVGAPVYIPGRWETWLLFIVAVALSSLVYFLLEFMVSSLAFWTSESAGPLFCFQLFLQFCAGTFFPLDVLPDGLRSAINMTPFPYIVFFPINIYLERLSPSEALGILAIQAMWLALFALGAKILWTKGLQNYSAEGG